MKRKKLAKEEFIMNARTVHGNKYDYSKSEYTGNDSKTCIICSIHGEFWQTPHSHLSGVGCSMCSKENNINESIITINKF